MLFLLAVHIEIKVRDAIRGYGVPSKVEVDGKEYASGNGRLLLDLESGRHRIRAEAEGYFPVKVEITVRRGGPPAYEILIQPKTLPQPPKVKEGYAIWYGWVVDSITLKPVPSVEVEVNIKGKTFKTLTDSSGYYALRVPIIREGDRTANVNVRFRRERYKESTKVGIPLIEGVYRLNVDLPPLIGEGKETR